MLQQSFWLNRSSPQDEFLKDITVRKCLKKTCKKLKLSAILPKMNSFKCIFHGFCYNIYVFLFYHVDKGIFEEHLPVFA